MYIRTLLREHTCLGAYEGTRTSRNPTGSLQKVIGTYTAVSSELEGVKVVKRFDDDERESVMVGKRVGMTVE